MCLCLFVFHLLTVMTLLTYLEQVVSRLENLESLQEMVHALEGAIQVETGTMFFLFVLFPFSFCFENCSDVV